MIKQNNYFWIITIFFIIVKLSCHLLTSCNYQLHRDEMFYFAMGSHLDFGYITNAPLIGFLAFISKGVFGYSEFGLKIFPCLAGTASVLIIALLVKETGGKAFALFTACLVFVLSPAYLRSNSLFMPVSFDEFFWLLIFYLSVRMINKNNPKYWLVIGCISGLAFLNKYSILFLIAGLLTAILLSQYKKLLVSKYLLIGTGIGLLIILPNAIWQYIHHWPVAFHMNELQKTQLVHVSLTSFLLGQILSNLPGLFVWLTGLASLIFYQAFRKYRFIGITYILILLIFIITKGKDYYTLGLYQILFVFGSVFLEQYFIGKLLFVKYFVIITAISVGIIILPAGLPVLNFKQLNNYCKIASNSFGITISRWEDGKIHKIPQDYADMTGWEELAKIVSKAYNTLGSAEKKHCTIYAENYGLAGAIQFYGHKYGLPAPISFHDSYILWAPDTISNDPFIYINSEVGDISKLFDSYPEIGHVQDENFRENGTLVLICTQPKKIWQEFYAAKVKKLKSRFN